MKIGDCNSLVHFPEAALPSQLRKIEIRSCNALESLPLAWMQDTSSPIESLSIEYCNLLTYIARVQLPPSLKRLEIQHCNNLRTLVEEEGIQNDSIRYNSLLEYLSIQDSPSLTSLFSKSELPASLDHLEVRDCSMLAFLSFNGNLPQSLKHLRVVRCSKLESIAERLDNNTSLEEIDILRCENLKILPDGLHKLHRLQELMIRFSNNLVSFPKRGLPCPKLRKIVISGCKKLEALPKDMHNLTSLQHLEISSLPSIVTFPEEGFPTNLDSLKVADRKICKALFEWGLQRFSSLRKLTINGGGCEDVMSFPQKEIGMMLPASLIELKILNFPILERLSSAFEDLISLEYLVLGNCLKLKYFPEKGLPISLLRLYIYRCPLIEEKCRKDGGQFWHLLTDIPLVKIRRNPEH